MPPVRRPLPRWNRRAVLALGLLALAGTAAAQVPSPQELLPLLENSYVLYRGQVPVPGLSQAQLLARAVAYARRQLRPIDSFAEDSFTAGWQVDSVQHLVSSTGQRPGTLALRYELLVYADDQGYRYVVQQMKTFAVRVLPPVAPATRPTVVHYHQPVEVYWDLVPLTGDNSSQLAGLAEFVGALNPEVEAILAQLQAEMARP